MTPEPAILTVVERGGRIVCRLPRRYRWELVGDFRRSFLFMNFRKARSDATIPEVSVPAASPVYKARLGEWLDRMNSQFPDLHVCWEGDEMQPLHEEK